MMNKNRIGRRVAAVVLLFAGSLAGMGTAQAALNLPTTNPDIVVSNLNVSYTGTSFTVIEGQFSGFNTTDASGTNVASLSGSGMDGYTYDLSASIDSSGTLIPNPNGTLSIKKDGDTTTLPGQSH